MPHQIPATGLEAAVAAIDDIVAGGYRRVWRDEGFEPNQQRLAAGFADLRHVVVRGDHISSPHPPPLAEKIREVELGDLAAVTRIDAHDPRSVAFDRDEQHLASAGGSRDGREPARPRLGTAGS